MLDASSLLTAIRKQLIRLSIGSCTCGVKSPDIQWHDGNCTFRLAEEIMENVDALESSVLDRTGGNNKEKSE